MSSDSNNVDPLPGSQWTLKQTKTFSWENGMAKYTDVTSDTALATVTDCVDGQSSVADCSAQTGEYVDLDGAAGRFKISGLAWGEYELIESKLLTDTTLTPLRTSSASARWKTAILPATGMRTATSRLMANLLTAMLRSPSTAATSKTSRE